MLLLSYAHACLHACMPVAIKARLSRTFGLSLRRDLPVNTPGKVESVVRTINAISTLLTLTFEHIRIVSARLIFGSGFAY